MLSFYVLGLQLTSPRGQTWCIAPHLASLPSAEGGYETPLGWFGVKWASGKGAWDANISTPQGTSGVLQLPINGTVLVDGLMTEPDESGIVSLGGGNHTITVQADS